MGAVSPLQAAQQGTNYSKWRNKHLAGRSSWLLLKLTDRKHIKLHFDSALLKQYFRFVSIPDVYRKVFGKSSLTCGVLCGREKPRIRAEIELYVSILLKSSSTSFAALDAC